MTAKEEEEDPRKINIPETEGEREVEGPKVENHDISKPLKMRQVNNGSDTQPKFAKIGDYWDEDMIDKVVELLHEYQDLFPTNFSNLKGMFLGVSRNAASRAMGQWSDPPLGRILEAIVVPSSKMFSEIKKRSRREAILFSPPLRLFQV